MKIPEKLRGTMIYVRLKKIEEKMGVAFKINYSTTRFDIWIFNKEQRNRQIRQLDNQRQISYFIKGN